MAIATNNDDVLVGTSGPDTIDGLDGNDAIYGSGGADSLIGGAGNDTLYAETGFVTQDTSVDTLSGGLGDDLLSGGFGDVFDGGAGTDVAQIAQAIGFATPVSLTLGADVWLQLAGVNNTHLIGIERISILASTGSDTITGGALSDNLYGGGGFDHLFGGGGNDVIRVEGPSFEVDGGSGNDLLYIENSVFSQDLAITVGGSFVSGGVAQAVTGIEAVSLTLVNHSATLTGGAFDDSATVTRGTLVAHGGDGVDRLSVNGTGHLWGDGGDDQLTLIGVGEAHGGTGNDEIHGTSLTGPVTLWGDAGNDLISGGDGVNIYGGDGDDTISTSFPFAGEVLSAGRGQDLLVASMADSGSVPKVGVSMAVGKDSFTVSVGGAVVATVSGFERLELDGTNFGDRLVGLAGNDSLFGDSEQEFNLTQGGNDTIYGGSGYDLLSGLGGNDQLFGGSGRDTLMGGAGQDTLSGGTSADVFQFFDVTDSKIGFADVITDFTKGQDIIDLSRMDADTTTFGAQHFHFIGAANFTHHAGELRAFSSGGLTYLRGDVDGDGLVDFSVQLTGTITLATTDLIL